MTRPDDNLLKTISLLRRDRKFLEVVEWLQTIRMEIAVDTNQIRDTEHMLRSAGKFLFLEEILKYLLQPESYIKE